MRGQLIAASKRTSHALYASPAIDQDAAALALRLFCRARKARHFVVNHHAFNRSNLPRQFARSSAFQVAA